MALESLILVFVMAAAGRIVGRVFADQWEAAVVRADDLRARQRRLY
jgi:hypothetical protein